jgi:hypothetical protein
MTGENTVKCIRAQRIKWPGSFNRMEKNKKVRKITGLNPIKMRYKGSTYNTRGNEVLKDLKKLNSFRLFFSVLKCI